MHPNSWGHADFMMSQWYHSSMVHFLVLMDRESPYLYTGSKYRGIGSLYRKSREGVATTPRSEEVLQKIPQLDEG